LSLEVKSKNSSGCGTGAHENIFGKKPEEQSREAVHLKGQFNGINMFENILSIWDESENSGLQVFYYGAARRNLRDKKRGDN
jgi:hypothetical protein